MSNTTIKNTGLLIADYPAYDVWEAQAEKRWDDPRHVVDVNHSDEFKVAFKSRSHGNLFHGFYFGSVVGYALECKKCPIEAVERTQRNAKDNPYAGHKLHWVSAKSTSLTAWDRPKESYVELKFGDLVRLDGRVFKLVPASNQNVALEPCPHEPEEVAE
jgi:hypothetical protein